VRAPQIRACSPRFDQPPVTSTYARTGLTQIAWCDVVGMNCFGQPSMASSKLVAAAPATGGHQGRLERNSSISRNRFPPSIINPLIRRCGARKISQPKVRVRPSMKVARRWRSDSREIVVVAKPRHMSFLRAVTAGTRRTPGCAAAKRARTIANVARHHVRARDAREHARRASALRRLKLKPHCPLSPSSGAARISGAINASTLRRPGLARAGQCANSPASARASAAAWTTRNSASFPAAANLEGPAAAKPLRGASHSHDQRSAAPSASVCDASSEFQPYACISSAPAPPRRMPPSAAPSPCAVTHPHFRTPIERDRAINTRRIQNPMAQVAIASSAAKSRE